MTRPRAARWFTALVTVLGATACSRNDPPPPSAAARVALIERGAGDAWSRRVRAGAVKAAREAGNIVLDVRIPGDAQQAGQASLVRELTNGTIGALVLAPDPDAGPDLGPALSEAAAAGVATVILTDQGAASLGAIQAPRVCSDDELAGRLAAEFVIEKIDGEGEVIVLGDSVGSDGADRREAAFREHLALHGAVKAFDAPPVGDAGKRAAQLAVDYALDAHPGARAIFCPTEQATAGALRSLRERNLAGRVKLVGVDTNPTLVEAMAAGEIDALIVRDPGDIGYRAVKAAIARSRGEPVEDFILTRVTLIARETMHEKGNMDALLPDLGPPGE